MENPIPKFMKDSSEKDGKCEIVADYVISWCLRRAQDDCANEKPILFGKCKFLLAKILDLTEKLNDIKFSRVETWKQESQIDIWVEVDAIIDGIKKFYAILIEDKYYTPIHDSKDEDGEYRNQLLVYRKKFDKYYSNRNNIDKKYVLISVSGDPEHNDRLYKKDCQKYGFKLFDYEDLKLNDNPSESDIYNEFWLNW